MFHLCILAGMFLFGATQVWAAATLENPVPGAVKSGVGLISGWVCDAAVLEVSLDGGPRQFVPYGSERTDTAGVCGDTDNGFGLLINYNELGDGPHTATLYADGMVVTLVSFNVQTLGTNFLRGVVGQGTIPLSNEIAVHVQWEETTQGFAIVGYDRGPPTSGSGDGDNGDGDGGGDNGNGGEGCPQAPVTTETECPEVPTTLAGLQADRDHMQAVLDDIVAGCVPLTDATLPGGYYTTGRHPYWGYFHCIDRAVFNIGSCVTDDIPTTIQTYYQQGGRITFIERESEPHLSPAGELIIKYDSSHTPGDKGIVLYPHQGLYYGRDWGLLGSRACKTSVRRPSTLLVLKYGNYSPMVDSVQDPMTCVMTRPPRRSSCKTIADRQRMRPSSAPTSKGFWTG